MGLLYKKATGSGDTQVQVSASRARGFPFLPIMSSLSIFTHSFDNNIFPPPSSSSSIPHHSSHLAPIVTAFHFTSYKIFFFPRMNNKQPSHRTCSQPVRERLDSTRVGGPFPSTEEASIYLSTCLPTYLPIYMLSHSILFPYRSTIVNRRGKQGKGRGIVDQGGSHD